MDKVYITDIHSVVITFPMEIMDTWTYDGNTYYDFKIPAKAIKDAIKGFELLGKKVVDIRTNGCLSLGFCDDFAKKYGEDNTSRVWKNLEHYGSIRASLEFKKNRLYYDGMLLPIDTCDGGTSREELTLCFVLE